MAPRISVVINTLNEEKNLPFALRSVQSWVDEIIVVDMYSTDRTVEIARQFGAQIHLHRGPGFNYAPRAFAVTLGSSEWILMLDADELIPVALSRELRRIADSGEADVVDIPFTTYMLGAVIHHTGWGPTEEHHMRFFRKGFLVGTSLAHQDFKPVDGARISVLPHHGDNAVVHFSYLNSQQFIEKLNRYTSIEAQQAFEAGFRTKPVRALLRGIMEFRDRYITAGGFRDGWRGFYLSLFMCFYRIVMRAKLYELTVLGPREAIESRYRQEAEEILKAYGGTHSPTAS